MLFKLKFSSAQSYLIYKNPPNSCDEEMHENQVQCLRFGHRVWPSSLSCLVSVMWMSKMDIHNTEQNGKEINCILLFNSTDVNCHMFDLSFLHRIAINFKFFIYFNNLKWFSFLDLIK